jgi:hypothetical protein
MDKECCTVSFRNEASEHLRLVFAFLFVKLLQASGCGVPCLLSSKPTRMQSATRMQW